MTRNPEKKHEHIFKKIFFGGTKPPYITTEQLVLLVLFSTTSVSPSLTLSKIAKLQTNKKVNWFK